MLRGREVGSLVVAVLGFGELDVFYRWRSICIHPGKVSNTSVGGAVRSHAVSPGVRTSGHSHLHDP